MEPKDFDTILNKYIEDITEQGTSDGFTGGYTSTSTHEFKRTILHAWYSVKLSCPRISIIARYPENKNTKY